MTTPTDTQLKQCLAKMLPEVIGDRRGAMRWLDGDQRRVLDTELLHLCWLVERSLHDDSYPTYIRSLHNTVWNDSDGKNTRWESATWKKRTIALAKVLGIEI